MLLRAMDDFGKKKKRCLVVVAERMLATYISRSGW